MIGDRMRLVLVLVVGVVILAGVVLGGRWAWGRLHSSPAPAMPATEISMPSPTSTEWGAEKFPTATPTPTPTPIPTATPVKTGVDAFGLPEGYQPEAGEEEIPDLKELAPQEPSPEVPGVELPGGEQKPGIIEQIPGLIEKGVEKGKELVEKTSPPTPTPTPQPRGGIAGTGIPLWLVILIVVVVVVLIVVAFRAGFIGIESD